ncbi:LysM peptidoglycan-binding domain-containing protein [Margalitia sp. FSL K6-0131]|uniref:cell division suppressor protein YneA n=1 Tax=Margalitia sp. FSL K6-0131 TaxID=2954604 RepID=UPI0030FBEB27
MKNGQIGPHFKKQVRNLIKNNNYVLMLLIMTVLLSIFLILNLSTDESQNYLSIKVKEGDSVWSYAVTYQNESKMSKQEFIQWVEKKNNVDAAYIQAGDSLIIPVKTGSILSSKNLVLGNKK